MGPQENIAYDTTSPVVSQSLWNHHRLWYYFSSSIPQLLYVSSSCSSCLKSSMWRGPQEYITYDTTSPVVSKTLWYYHRLWYYFSSSIPQLFYVSLSCSSCLRSSMWRGPQEYIAYDTTSPVVSKSLWKHHRLWYYFSSSIPQLFYISLSCSSCLRSSMWRGPQEYIAYDTASPVVSQSLWYYHRLWYYFSSSIPQLFYECSSCSSCLRSSMWRGPQEYIAYDTTSPVVSHSCFM